MRVLGTPAPFGSRAALLAIGACAALSASSCGGTSRPPAVLDEPPSQDAASPESEVGGAMFDVAADSAIHCGAAEESGLCACAEIAQRPTTLYIVLDRSGSMNEVIPPATRSKWEVIRLALLDGKRGVLRGLGGRVAVGLTLFPGKNVRFDQCAIGSEVIELTQGSPSTYELMATVLVRERPAGGTPTAATMRDLLAKVKTFPAPAFVLLATDGGPNCATTPCDIAHCTYNIDRIPHFCDDTVNCCDPKVVKGGGWEGCLDAEATRLAVADLASAGVKTFVFGIPGVGPYAAELDKLAVAGGTARDVAPPAPRFYSAADATQEAFEAALKAIAAKVVDSCLIRLDRVPRDRGVTNVLLDGELTAQDPVDGWAWVSDLSIELRGKSCARVRDGSVSRIQVAVGCRTVTI